MSLVIALKCIDGIVVASDTGMSLRSNSDPSDYISVYAKKIYPGKEYVFALAGTVWINQKVKKLADEVFGMEDEVEEGSFKRFLEGMSEIIKNDIELRSGTGIEDPNMVKEGIAINALVAYVDKNGKNVVWTVDNYLKGRYVDEKFVVFAENDLAYAPLKEYEDEGLTIAEGKLAVFKAIKDTIRLSPVFLAEPIEIYTINRGDRKIAEVSSGERELLEAAYKRIRIGSVELLRKVAADIPATSQHKDGETIRRKDTSRV